MKTYTFTDDLGDENEMRAGPLETAFIAWAMEEGYEEMDAVLVCCEMGSDVPCSLDDAWEPFQAGYRSVEQGYT